MVREAPSLPRNGSGGIRLSIEAAVARFSLDDPEHGHAIPRALLDDLMAALHRVEHDSACRILVLEGSDGIFCTGMDLHEVTRLAGAQQTARLRESIELYAHLLRRLTRFPKPVICLVDGKVLAGGIGLVAAADVVVASPRSTFALTEARWGLLPANVMPYLIRRVGFQKAYWMALTTQTVAATEACAMGLVDQVGEEPQMALRQVILRLLRLPPETAGALKRFVGDLWTISDETERFTAEESFRLASDPAVQARIRGFLDIDRPGG